MCGIVGYIGTQNAVPILLKGLEKLEYRGYDSAGISVHNDGIQTIKTKGRLKNLADKIESENFTNSSIGIGHTRWATHGAPSDRNSHPHNSQNGKFSVVHNGIIENYMELKEELTESGVTFVSETDSEVVAHLFEKLYNGNPLETLQLLLPKLRGAYALGIVCSDHPDELFAVRKDSPLLIGLGKNENFIASDIPALLQNTRDYYLIDDHEIAVLTKDDVKLYDTNGNTIEKEIFHVTWDIDAAEKGGHDYFMMKEILEQPEAMQKTIHTRLKHGKIELNLETITEENLLACNRIHIVACGSAYHAGIIGRYVIEAFARVPVEVDIASEFRYRNPIIGENDICIILSQSGETADTLAALREAKNKGASIVSIVNVVGSSIARESDDVLYTWAGPEIAVATTKGYSTQLGVLYLLAMELGKVKGTFSTAQMSEYLKELEEMPHKIEDLLKTTDEKMKALAKKYAKHNDIFMIGRGIDYGSALEAALKLKEISYIHCEAYGAGELKHGTISLIEENTLVVAFGTQDDLFEKLVSNTKEVAARGATVLGITTLGNTAMENVAEEVVYLPKASSYFLTTYAMIPMQLFAYYVAVERGCDVDKPRNLAKSVTVE
ncbi:MAG: glutamine--fructose-6-phosphate transaminase (isomerizing) [Bacillota bacterium]